jgi:predicted Zn-dependent protease
MSFEALVAKVRQAETALEAKERQASADFRQLKSSWRAAWTPGRIVVAGLVTGFIVGKLEPGKKAARGGGILQLLTALSGMVAGTQASAAAGKAEDAAESAEDVAEQAPAP